MKCIIHWSGTNTLIGQHLDDQQDSIPVDLEYLNIFYWDLRRVLVVFGVPCYWLIMPIYNVYKFNWMLEVCIHKNNKLNYRLTCY